MIETAIHNAICYHCGDKCQSEQSAKLDNKQFCCSGCLTVYQILNKSDLCDYYSFNKVAGVKVNIEKNDQRFSFLDNPTIAAKYISFDDQHQTAVKFYLPQIHCSSCIWLLENLQKLESNIFFSTVNFPAKEVSIFFNHHNTSVKSIAELLFSIGYEPHFSLDIHESSATKNMSIQRTTFIKIGIAGFCFANIMMLSFPEYLGLATLNKDGLSPIVFRSLNLLLSLPVILYSGNEFFVNSWYGLKQKMLNIDAPIALALIITFLRSVYEIISGTGGGYLDSMTGIILFMLVGRAFQTKTFANLQFSRDYKSYFPIAICKLDELKNETYLVVNEIKVDDCIRIRNNEVIPVDGILLNGKALIDYSFVTGEIDTIDIGIGKIVYAGGKQCNGMIDIMVVKPFSQSNFTSLWNNDLYKKESKKRYTFVGIISIYFSVAVIFIATLSFIYWINVYPPNAWNALTSVLIVACPCALLLTTTFTQGFILNIFSEYGMYLKNADVLQTIPNINHIVFDKTGTLTYPNKNYVKYVGESLNALDLKVFTSMFAQSLHPLSRGISNSLKQSSLILDNVKNIPGFGIEAWDNDNYYKAGSVKFIGENSLQNTTSEVWISINEKVLGKFEVINQLRENIDCLINQLPFNLTILSGDNNSSQDELSQKFIKEIDYQFNQTPENKLNYITQLQHNHQLVMMVGDGLNDAGALCKSDVGIAIVENTIQFSPASDAILLANKLPFLNQFIVASILAKKLIAITFIVSIIYNAVGLYFSTTAQLKPIIAAILMPLSTLSIVTITLLGSLVIKKKCFKNV